VKIKYVSTLPDGVLKTETGLEYPWKRGVPIEVPDELGDRLLAKSPLVWRKAHEEKTKEKEK
jgi:hypothetical protein